MGRRGGKHGSGRFLFAAYPVGRALVSFPSMLCSSHQNCLYSVRLKGVEKKDGLSLIRICVNCLYDIVQLLVSMQLSKLLLVYSRE